MKDNILYIDTTSNKKVIVEINGEKITEESQGQIIRSQVLLPMIDQILKKVNLKPNELSEIKVNTGPGSYTGIRVGLSVANTMAVSLGIKVNGKEFETEAIY